MLNCVLYSKVYNMLVKINMSMCKLQNNLIFKLKQSHHLSISNNVL